MRTSQQNCIHVTAAALALLLSGVLSPAAVAGGASDAFEPDNTPGDARAITRGATQSRTLGGEDVADYAFFDLAIAARVRVEVLSRTLQGELTLFGDLLGGATDVLAYDPAASADGRYAIETPLRPGRYFILVEAPGGGTPSRNYQLSFGVESTDGFDLDYRFARVAPLRAQRHDFTGVGPIAHDGEGTLYTLDPETFVVRRYTSVGQFLTQWETIPGATDLAVVPGFVLVRNGATGELKLYDSEGNFIAQNPFALPGDAGQIAGRAFADGRLRFYVELSPPTQTLVFDPESGTISPVDIFDNGTGQPFAVLSNGDVAAINASRSGITVISRMKQGAATRVLTSKGDSIYTDITVDANDNIYVTDSLGGRVVLFDSEGNQLAQFGAGPGLGLGQLSRPLFLTAHRQGQIYVRDSADILLGDGTGLVAANSITRFATNGTPLARFAQSGARPGEFGAPRGIVSDANGVVVIDTLNRRVQQLSPDLQFESEFSDPNPDSDGTFRQPRGVALGPDGTIWVADFTGSVVVQFDVDGTPLRVLDPAALGVFFDQPADVAVASDGTLYIIEAETDTIIVRAPGGAVSVFGGNGTQPGRFEEPAALAISPDGAIYVADARTGRVQRFSSDGQFEWAFQPADPEEPCGCGQPFDLAFDDDGFLYIAEAQTSVILKTDAYGNFVSRIGSFGTAPGQLRIPGGVTVAPDGVVYVSDTGNDRVQRFVPETAAPAKAKGTTAALSGRKAIIVAARGPGSSLSMRRATEHLSALAWRALRNQGFASDELRLYSPDTPFDLDGDRDTVEVFPLAKSALLEAIQNWASDAETLLIYVIGPADGTSIQLNPAGETLGVFDLSSALDVAQAGGQQVAVVLDTPGAGAFNVAQLQADDRILITGTRALQPAFYLADGTVSFSYYFWTALGRGDSLQGAFDTASRAVNRRLRYQVPRLTGSFTNTALPKQHKNDDANAVRDFSPVDYTQIPPTIENVVDVIDVDETATDALLSASNVKDADDVVATVQVVVTPPVELMGGATAITDLPVVELQPESMADFEAVAEVFAAAGAYQLDYIALDQNFNPSEPERGYAVKSGGIVPASLSVNVFNLDTEQPVTSAFVCIVPGEAPCVDESEEGVYFFFGIFGSGYYDIDAAASGFEDAGGRVYVSPGDVSVSATVLMEPLPLEGIHSADTNPPDNRINLSELLRVIQFFNGGGIVCNAASEDGYDPGASGDRTCAPHDSDYAAQDWAINLTELLRLIQFFNFGGYALSEASEDGYVPAEAS